jgi:hypothetical protein
MLLRIEVENLFKAALFKNGNVNRLFS